MLRRLHEDCSAHYCGIESITTIAPTVGFDQLELLSREAERRGLTAHRSATSVFHEDTSEMCEVVSNVYYDVNGFACLGFPLLYSYRLGPSESADQEKHPSRIISRSLIQRNHEYVGYD